MPLPPDLEKRKPRLVVKCRVQAKDLQSHVDALERVPDPGKAKHYPYIPIRFVPNEKVTKYDKLLLAFDALVLTTATGKIPLYGKIVHGGEQGVIKVPLAGLMETTRAVVDKIAAQQGRSTSPQLILNPHCAECEFQAQCRQKAIEQDDLSLLSGMTEKERKKQHDKGIFTVTQLSYTFRPRRRSNRSSSRPEKNHPALRALAIREQKIHIAGKPELKMTGNPVYLDVEGIPDRDCYYLIGIRFKSGGSFVQHSFWANEQSEEKDMWASCLQLLSEIENPQLLHYGSYETVFLKQMKQRYSETVGDTAFVERLIAGAVNLLSVIYGQIYFPTYSNALKAIAPHLGFRWSQEAASGAISVMWRSQWERSRDPSLKQRLVTYNAEDCQALEVTTGVVAQLCEQQNRATEPINSSIVYADNIKGEYPIVWGKIDFAMPEMEYINQCAYWDYQREKVLLRNSARIKNNGREKAKRNGKILRPNKIVKLDSPRPACCADCGASTIYRYGKFRKTIYDLKFGPTSVKRWIITYRFDRYICYQCRSTFFSKDRPWTRSTIGPSLMAYIVYQLIDLHLAQRDIVRNINDLFDYNLNVGAITNQKARASQAYKSTYEAILHKLVSGNLIHADETKIKINGKDGFVWVLTSLEEVFFFYKETREGDTIRELLQDFKGVLVSDFYSVYDSFDCPQQKCLIHLMRDINDDLHRHPFDTEMKQIAHDFSMLLKPIVETVDRFGLKSRFLRKHNVSVTRFFEALSKRKVTTDVAIGYQQRFQRNRDKLFTFLNHDGIPWNNNNAEHAIKAFAVLRQGIRGMSTESGIREYLTLMSVRETCKYKGAIFLDFLRSEEKDIDVFLERKRRANRNAIRRS